MCAREEDDENALPARRRSEQRLTSSPTSSSSPSPTLLISRLASGDACFVCGERGYGNLRSMPTIKVMESVKRTGIIPQRHARVCEGCLIDDVATEPRHQRGRTVRSIRVRSRLRPRSSSPFSDPAPSTSDDSSRLEEYHEPAEEVVVADWMRSSSTRQ